jgi:hypothetical protein
MKAIIRKNLEKRLFEMFGEVDPSHSGYKARKVKGKTPEYYYPVRKTEYVFSMEFKNYFTRVYFGETLLGVDNVFGLSEIKTWELELSGGRDSEELESVMDWIANYFAEEKARAKMRVVSELLSRLIIGTINLRA